MRALYLLAVLLVTCAAIRPAGQIEAQTPSPPGDAATTLLPGDGLGVQIWREPDLSGHFIVDEEGIVTLPLLGRIQVTGISVPELRERLLAGYGEELRNPSITITPLRRIHVLGEVNRPGLLEVDPTITLAGAVALAGGANFEGDLRKLRIMRDGEVLLAEVGPEAELATVGIRSGDQIFVDRRRWIDRHSTFLVSSTIGIAGIIVTLLR